MSSIDLNSPPPGHEFNVSVERVETDGERYVRLFKDVVQFVMALVFVSLIVTHLRDFSLSKLLIFRCLWFLFLKNPLKSMVIFRFLL